MEADMPESALKLMNYEGLWMIYGDTNEKYWLSDEVFWASAAPALAIGNVQT